MERCPNCSTPARPGAKFCTTCGFRFDEGEAPTAAATGEGNAHDRSELNVYQSNEEFEAGNWPSASASPETRLNNEAPSPSHQTADEFDTDAAQNTDYVGFWPELSSESWPTLATESTAASERENPAPALAPRWDRTLSAPEPTTGERENADSLETIHGLLDRLRDAIDAMDREAPLYLSSVVSDLEVAVTPPGAMPPDQVAELREALFAARDHPRDIDTMVDLTKRIDTLVALVIAYDRAIAAIERSLDALKRTDQPGDTESPSPTEAGEGMG